MDRRNRPAERAALLAGAYRDVVVITVRTTLQGGNVVERRYVEVVAKDGRVIALFLGLTGDPAQAVAQVLIAQMTPEDRERYEAKVLREHLRPRSRVLQLLRDILWPWGRRAA